MKRNLRILVLYYYNPHLFRWRLTIKEHLYSFRNYLDDVDFVYFNALLGIPRYIKEIKFDAVILHYTLLSLRWDRYFFSRWEPTLKNLMNIDAYKVAIPQDEYAETKVLCEFFRKYNVKTVFTCFKYKDDYYKAYPPQYTGIEDYIHVFAGYIDEINMKKVVKMVNKYHVRPIDVGYRARKLPYWLGEFSQLKWMIGRRFLEKAEGSSLKVDISTDYSDVFYGYEWYRFLARSRATLGCESGASILDWDGSLKEKVECFMEEHPRASFEEVRKSCFHGRDYEINLATLSPRHFEAAVTRTCQILLEGDYENVFVPGKHYIKVKKDFSNIDEVIDKVKNKSFCNDIADNVYRDIVMSGKYGYRKFAELVVNHIKEKVGCNQIIFTCNISLSKYPVSMRELMAIDVYLPVYSAKIYFMKFVWGIFIWKSVSLSFCRRALRYMLKLILGERLSKKLKTVLKKRICAE